MSEPIDPDSDLDKLRDLPLRSEEIGFAPDALIACTKCGRPNAPSRAECLYCGAVLEGSTAEERLDIYELENWENGFNVVVVGSDSSDFRAAAAMLASIVSKDAEPFEAILNSETPLPVARIASDRHAGLLAEKLGSHGIKTKVISDEALSPNIPPVRLRALEFGMDELVLHPFSGGPSTRLGSDEVALVISGLIYESKTQSIEKRKRKVTNSQVETNLSSDESVIDLYSNSDNIGWRVPTTGFDFSCLGSDKSLLASENMERLVARLSAFASKAKFVLDYANVRSMLEHSWPSESRKDGLGFKRSGFGRKDLSSVFTTSNALQLLKYSRLRRHLV
jgi:hypothetical protein